MSLPTSNATCRSNPRAYKLAVLSAADRILTHVHRVLPDLADADLWDLIAAVTSVAAGLHQVVHPPPTLAALYREDPQLGHANVEFAASLQRITEVILLGFEHRHAQRAPCGAPTQNRSVRGRRSG